MYAENPTVSTNKCYVEINFMIPLSWEFAKSSLIFPLHCPHISALCPQGVAVNNERRNAEWQWHMIFSKYVKTLLKVSKNLNFNTIKSHLMRVIFTKYIYLIWFLLSYDFPCYTTLTDIRAFILSSSAFQSFRNCMGYSTGKVVISISDNI